ncbi:MAG TPA: SGNH/GDSL hydrolase family protein [Phycisphaerae bacterium]|nr:SGNH/GDSL hydrolase family protein [Phycisphaerae bacterium]
MFTSLRPSSRLVRLAALLLVPALLATSIPAFAKGIIEKGDRVVIVGDSITEQKQYSKFIEDYLTMCVPQLDLWVFQLGWSDETAGGFVGRMDQDLFPFKPDVITTCYGMNDGGYRAYEERIGEEYLAQMRQIIKAAREAGATIVVGSPGVVDTKTWRGPADVYNDNLAHLRDIARDLAASADMPFANVHDAMMDVMTKAKAAYGENYHVGGDDGVHPAPNGHLVMAYAFLKAMGFDGDLGTITVNMAGPATATGGHKVLSSAGGTVELESTRYPFCFFGDDTSPDSTRSVLPFVAFNEDLNRLTLIVKGLAGGKATVAWGPGAPGSKSFTAEQLAQGINLAAEFLDNPFCAAFQKVDGEIAAKQKYETWLIQSNRMVLAGTPKAKSPRWPATALAEYDALVKAVRAAFVPVKHTLTVTPE